MGKFVQDNSELIRKFSDIKINRIWPAYIFAIAIPFLAGKFYTGDKFLIALISLTLVLLVLVSTQLVIANKKISILFEIVKNEK